MKRIFKSISFAFVSIVALSMVSCTPEDDGRTQAQEEAELNELIQVLIQDGYDVDTTDLGVYYITHEPGTGNNAMPLDTISILYEGFLTDGSMFDASQNYYDDGIWEFVFTETPLIPGFDDGLAHMNKGAEMEFIIPSWLAYGAYGSPTAIGPFSTLIFAVKMDDIKPVSE